MAIKQDQLRRKTSARMKVTEGHIGWADIIFVMEKKHLRRIRDKFGDLLYEKKIVNADEYQFMAEELIEILQNRVSEII